MRLAILAILAVNAVSLAAEFNIKISAPMYFFPPVTKVVFTEAGSPGPGEAKHTALAEYGTINGEWKLTAKGPVDLWVVPKGGKPLKAISQLKLTDNTEIKLADYLGVIRCKGADLPRGKLIVTDHQDRGPEDKKHAAIQWANDSRTELIVPPGDYAVWISPDTGARARRISEKIRVLPGRTADVE
ncbi:hypothetical protein [Zavarzinella formosa]|uniref:hypothetical protein n=1 Tax=Zavarzinella formosa TaxID=360055 RepID=UPI0002E1D2CE|nr:hypothetical protein [Zavarzinella formosa]